MTKKEWMDIRTDTPPIEVFFEYYKEMGGKLTILEDFKTILYDPFLADGGSYITKNGKRVSRQSAENKLRYYYDEKFGIKD